jgi:hypothetical protein
MSNFQIMLIVGLMAWVGLIWLVSLIWPRNTPEQQADDDEQQINAIRPHKRAGTDWGGQ